VDNKIVEEDTFLTVIRRVVEFFVWTTTAIIDCFGNYVSIANAKASSTDAIDRAIFAPILKVSDIALINVVPMLTGSAMVDGLAPIGKGQNMLIIGQDTDVDSVILLSKLLDPT